MTGRSLLASPSFSGHPITLRRYPDPGTPEVLSRGLFPFSPLSDIPVGISLPSWLRQNPEPKVFADSTHQSPRYSAPAHGNWILDTGRWQRSQSFWRIRYKPLVFQCILRAKNVCASSLASITGNTACYTEDRMPTSPGCSESSHIYTPPSSGCHQSCVDGQCQVQGKL